MGELSSGKTLHEDSCVDAACQQAEPGFRGVDQTCSQDCSITKIVADRKTVWRRGVAMAPTLVHCRPIRTGYEGEPNEVDERKVRGYKMVKCGGSVRSVVGHQPLSLFM